MHRPNEEKLRLLVVDDEQNILNSLRRLLRNGSYEVAFAGSAEEALRIMGEEPIHVLLTDNKMPGKSGIELVKETKLRHPDSIRMLFSGESDMQSVINAINEGEVYRFILKPWNDVELKVAVSLAFAHWKLNEDVRFLVRRNRELEQTLRNLLKSHPELELRIGRGEAEMLSPGVESNTIDH